MLQRNKTPSRLADARSEVYSASKKLTANFNCHNIHVKQLKLFSDQSTHDVVKVRSQSALGVDRENHGLRVKR